MKIEIEPVWRFRREEDGKSMHVMLDFLNEKLLKEGAEPTTDTPEHFAAYIRSEIDKWAGVVRLAGITAQ